MHSGNQETAFLLGDLPDEEVSRIETELLKDDDRFEQLQETENRLLDDYVRNRLSRGDEEKFERHYLQSPIHAERVAFARQLLKTIDQTRAEPMTARVSPRPGILERLGLRPLSWQYALAGLLLVGAIAAVWVLLKNSASHSELTQTKSAPESQIAQQPPTTEPVTAGSDENKKSEAEKLPAAKTSNQKPPAVTRLAKSKQPEILAFSLSPVLVRSSSDQQVLTIPADSNIVRLNLRVDHSEKRRFNTTIRTVEGEEVWRQQNMKIRLDRNGNASIMASVPSRALPGGDYILTLTAINSPASQEEINRYFFRVLRK